MSKSNENIVMYSTGIVLTLCVLMLLNTLSATVQGLTPFLLLAIDVTFLGTILVFSINIIAEVKDKV